MYINELLWGFRLKSNAIDAATRQTSSLKGPNEQFNCFKKLYIMSLYVFFVLDDYIYYSGCTVFVGWLALDG